MAVTKLAGRTAKKPVPVKDRVSEAEWKVRTDLAAAYQLAVVYGWKALGVLGREHAFTQNAAKFLAWCAWMAVACESWSLLMRPVKTHILTSHLPAAAQLAAWSFNPKDLLVVLLCAVLVCFAHMMGWAAEVADENKGFI